MSEEKKGFRIDRTISIGLLVTVIIQVGIIIWSASKISENVRVNSENLFRMEEKLDQIGRDHQENRNDVYSLITKIREETTELKYKVKNLEEK